MAKQLLNFKGIYGEQESPFWDSTIHIEPLKKRSSVYNFEINEHLHTDLVQIFFIENGGGDLFSEGKQIQIDSPCIIVIPNGVLHGFIWSPPIVGIVITISTEFYQNSLKKNQNTVALFQQLQHFSLEQGDGLYKEIKNISLSLEEELKGQKIEKQNIIGLLLNLLMVKLYRKSITGESQVLSNNNNKTLTYFNNFQKAIFQTIEKTKTIREYAQILNITPVHLNRICQTLVQKSALQIVHEKQTTQAKNYLLYTDKTISEIAYSLGFKEPSHFSKFFKKMVGISPRRFRKSQDRFLEINAE